VPADFHFGMCAALGIADHVCVAVSVGNIRKIVGPILRIN